jgi:hypothetical protein
MRRGDRAMNEVTATAAVATPPRDDVKYVVAANAGRTPTAALRASAVRPAVEVRRSSGSASAARIASPFQYPTG